VEEVCDVVASDAAGAGVLVVTEEDVAVVGWLSGCRAAKWGLACRGGG
jgi:hypothetical protein